MCSFVVKLTLSQILLILPEFTRFIFTTINTFINTDTTFTTKYTNFIKINTGPVTGPKCSPNFGNLIGVTERAQNPPIFVFQFV